MSRFFLPDEATSRARETALRHAQEGGLDKKQTYELLVITSAWMGLWLVEEGDRPQTPS